MPPTATPVPGTGPAPGTGNSIISPGPLTAARLVRAVADATVREAAAAAVIGVTWPTWILGAVTPRLRAPTSTGEVPVLLIHGYGASKSNWLHLRRRLRDAGHRHVHAMGYVPVGGIRQLGSRVTERALRLMDRTGSDRVHLVGHSLGGVLARWAVQVGGLDGAAATVVTLGSPHGGAPLARLAPGVVARELRPGSALLEELRRTATGGPTRWVAVASLADAVVPARRALITEAALAPTNVVVPDEGHLSLTVSPRVARIVLDALAGSSVAEPAPVRRSRRGAA